MQYLPDQALIDYCHNEYERLSFQVRNLQGIVHWHSDVGGVIHYLVDRFNRIISILRIRAERGDAPDELIYWEDAFRQGRTLVKSLTWSDLC
jgi:hypothetical protein